MYNALIKFRYISEKDKKEIRHIFNKSEKYERALSKDLYEMSHEEFRQFIYNLQYKNNDTLEHEVSQYKKYIDWCVSEGLGHNCIVLDKKEKKACLREVNRFLSRNKLLDKINLLQNPCDKVILLSIMEGLCQHGDNFQPLFHKTVNDIVEIDHSYYLLIENDYYPVSEEFVFFAKESAQCYDNYGHSRVDHWKNDNYIIKRSKNERSDKLENYGCKIRIRIRKAKKELSIQEKDLYLSAKLSVLHQMCYSKKVTIDELFLHKEWLGEYLTKFGELTPIKVCILRREYKAAFLNNIEY